MHQRIGSALVQIMACGLFGAKPVCLVIVNWTIRNKIMWNFNQNSNIFIQENVFENSVCEMTVILSRVSWVNTTYVYVTTGSGCTPKHLFNPLHYDDVILDTMVSEITSLTIVYSTVYSDADQRKHQSFASLAFVRGIHRGPVNCTNGQCRGKCFHLMTSSWR